MKIQLISPGKTKANYYQLTEAHYLELIAHQATIQIQNVKENAKDVEAEGNAIIQQLEKLNGWPEQGYYTIALDESGKQFSSRDFANHWQNLVDQGKRQFIFIVGGAYGLSEAVKQKCNLTFSLSSLTFPHELAKVVLLEQIYRALQINKGSKYHHD